MTNVKIFLASFIILFLALYGAATIIRKIVDRYNECASVIVLPGPGAK